MLNFFLYNAPSVVSWDAFPHIEETAIVHGECAMVIELHDNCHYRPRC